ncbi:hypothetical protein M747DRAFT_99932 [Aspergillus niger ATCC 13496]|uniref:Uncharacterized protein n=1 Tax=Aspergillus niger ATCC 13496 TaxID=1353008 RepID=A0A370BT97_ASPNG|nr:hypothetical protein M747DRAFT_99932 [Aspergillus niger ATCC 13496]
MTGCLVNYVAILTPPFGSKDVHQAHGLDSISMRIAVCCVVEIHAQRTKKNRDYPKSRRRIKRGNDHKTSINQISQHKK